MISHDVIKFAENQHSLRVSVQEMVSCCSLALLTGEFMGTPWERDCHGLTLGWSRPYPSALIYFGYRCYHTELTHILKFSATVLTKLFSKSAQYDHFPLKLLISHNYLWNCPEAWHSKSIFGSGSQLIAWVKSQLGTPPWRVYRVEVKRVKPEMLELYDSFSVLTFDLL